MPDLHPYSPSTQPADGLWLRDGDFPPLPFQRRMTTLHTARGLVLHGVMRMRDEDLKELEARGPVAVLLLPNWYHKADLAWYAERFPDAEVHAPPELLDKARERVPRARSAAASPDLDVLPLAGTRIGETAWLHRPTRSLVLTDLVFNYTRDDFAGLRGGLFMRLNRGDRGLAMTRFFRWTAVARRSRLRASLRELLAWDFDRVIMNHGHVIEEDGKRRLAEALDV